MVTRLQRIIQNNGKIAIGSGLGIADNSGTCDNLNISIGERLARDHDRTVRLDAKKIENRCLVCLLCGSGISLLGRLFGLRALRARIVC